MRCTKSGIDNAADARFCHRCATPLSRACPKCASPNAPDAKFCADGIFAMFGAPLAHEDHPQRALYAAIRMQEDLRRYAAALRERGQAPIEIRIGVNTGEVVVRAIQTAAGRAEYTPIGHTNNLASRMQTVAATSTIAATDDTRKLCEGYFTFRSCR